MTSYPESPMRLLTPTSGTSGPFIHIPERREP
jgi:hypothetical protein